MEVCVQSVNGLSALPYRYRSTRPASLEAVASKSLYLCRRLLFIQTFAPSKRALDFTFSLLLLALFSPVVLLLMLRNRLTGGTLVGKTEKVGREGRHFQEFSFEQGGGLLANPILRRLPVLWNILSGQMSFIGPRALQPSELPSPGWNDLRFEVRPGLVCPSWLRRRVSINFDEDARVDDEYLQSANLLGDLGIALRAIPAILLGQAAAANSDVLDILGLPVNNVEMRTALHWIEERLNGRQGSRIAFVNPHCVNVACADSSYRKALLTADLILGDGVGLVVAGKLKRCPLRQNVNGTDMFPRLCKLIEQSGHSVFLLGGRPGVAESVAAWIRTTHPKARIAGQHHGYFSRHETAEVNRQIRESGASLLLVAFGVPRQELWIEEFLEDTGVKVAVGVGGLFDFFSGRIPRAPVWMREVGMEWFYRFAQEPGRMWKRYLIGNWVFLGRVILNELNLYKPAVSMTVNTTGGK